MFEFEGFHFIIFWKFD